MATKTKQAKQFQEIASDVPTKGHKTRQSSNSQSINQTIMENSTNEKLLSIAQKQDERNEPKETILQASKNGNDTNEPENGNDTNEQKKQENLMKKYATDFFKKFEENLLNDLVNKSLRMSLTTLYGFVGNSLFDAYMYATQNGRFTFANSVDEKCKKDSKEITITTKVGEKENTYKLYKVDMNEIPTTIACVIARYNSWATYAKKCGNIYVREIETKERKIKEEQKAQQVINNMDNETAQKMLFDKCGVDMEQFKAFLEFQKAQQNKK